MLVAVFQILISCRPHKLLIPNPTYSTVRDPQALSFDTLLFKKFQCLKTLGGKINILENWPLFLDFLKSFVKYQAYVEKQIKNTKHCIIALWDTLYLIIIVFFNIDWCFVIPCFDSSRGLYRHRLGIIVDSITFLDFMLL